MDELHYRILEENTECWALLSSVENPFIYLPVKCFIHSVNKYNTMRYSYLLRPIEFVDDFKTVSKYFNNSTYRVYNPEKNRVSDTTFQFDESLMQTTKAFCKHFDTYYSDEYLVALAPVVFETKELCISALKNLEVRLAKEFERMIGFYMKRHKKYSSQS